MSETTAPAAIDSKTTTVESVRLTHIDTTWSQLAGAIRDEFNKRNDDPEWGSNGDVRYYHPYDATDLMVRIRENVDTRPGSQAIYYSSRYALLITITD